MLMADPPLTRRPPLTFGRALLRAAVLGTLPLRGAALLQRRTEGNNGALSGNGGRVGGKQVHDGKPRLAILLAGMSERLVLKPLISNVVTPNSKDGVVVDVFLALKVAKADFWKPSDVGYGEPWLWDMPTEGLDDRLCTMANEGGASLCKAKVVESEEVPTLPEDQVHQQRLNKYSPYKTATGVHLLQRWASLEKLWDDARRIEKRTGTNYTQVLVVRDDSFWAAPFRLGHEAFRGLGDMSMLTQACLEFGGINDKVFLLGRGAAEHMLRPFQAWLHDKSPDLDEAHNAEEFFAAMAKMQQVTTLATDKFPMALVTYQSNGIPCFRKTRAGKSGRCWSDAVLGSFFDALSCGGEVAASSREVLSSEEARALHKIFQRKPKDTIITMVSSGTRRLAQNFFCNLDALGLLGSVVALALEEHACQGFEGIDCIEWLPRPSWARSDARMLMPVAAVLMSGIIENIIVSDVDVAFLRNPFESRGGLPDGADAVFQVDNALRKGATSCNDLHGAQEIQLSPGFYRVRDTSGGRMLMLEAVRLLHAARSGGSPGSSPSRRGSPLLAKDGLETYSRVASWSCRDYANGNVFFGHPAVAHVDGVVAVRANWLKAAATQETCLRSARLWRLDADSSCSSAFTLDARPLNLSVRVSRGGYVVGC